MKKDFKSTLLLLIVVIAIIVVGKMILDMYHGGKLEWKHKDGHTKVKYVSPEYDEYE